MTPWSPEHVATRLGARTFSDPAPLSGRRAAVAAVLRFDRGRPEVLLIQRAERAGDRSSGQVSMPGGREEDGDADLVETALRETWEEVGLELRRPGSTPPILGRLQPVQAVARGQILPMTISPFVFARPVGLTADEPPLVLSAEAASAFWLPLDAAASGALDGRHEYQVGPLPMTLPCWRWQGFVVWGLTYKMLRTLIDEPGDLHELGVVTAKRRTVPAGTGAQGTTVTTSVTLPPPPVRLAPARRPGLAPTPPGSRAAAARRAAPAGAHIGRYVVVDLLGEGGMGVVYKAYDPELGRLVAIKRVHPDTSEPGGAARLIREAQAVAALSHPNVVAVHDVGEVDGDVFIAMEYVDGWRLKEWLAAARRPLGEFVGVFAQAAAGLAAAHDQGLVHRDFKPHNVLVGYDGRVRVVDFGLARPFGAAPVQTPARAHAARPVPGRALDRSLTPAGVALGTPRYMAPEQHLGRTLDGRADQWAFCVALYEALVGRPPFPARQHAELVRQVVGGKARPVPRDAPVPRWLRVLVTRGLAPDPAARWPSMHDVLAELGQDHGAQRRAALGTERHGERMLAAFPPPEDEGAGTRVRELARRLERARARKERGQDAEALALATELAGELGDVDYLPLHAATAFLTGELRERLGDAAGARVALEQALGHAAAAGDDWQLAAAWVRLVHVVGVGQGRVAEAETLAQVARIACRRCGDNPSLRSRLATHRGLVARAAGRVADALPHLREALALDESAYGPRHWFVAMSLLGVAEAYLDAGDGAAARPYAARAEAICQPAIHEPTPTRLRCAKLLGRLDGGGRGGRA